MRCLVTGVAGFIGSHLAEALLAAGHEVIGLDAFIPYYPRTRKETHLAALHGHPRFTFHECDLRSDPIPLEGAEAVFHLAAMPGLLASWVQFDLYATCNIQATQRLLDAVTATGSVSRFIHVSTSSIYGEYVVGDEDTLAQPISPYGITKLAAEHLVQSYAKRDKLPTTILRYYSVFGPRQRPDMGYQVFIERLLKGEAITIFGDGSQRRASTYVGDIVAGTLLAFEQFKPGAIYNLGGNEEVSVLEVVQTLEGILGVAANLHYAAARPGEQSRAVADITRAQRELGYQPQVSMQEGLTRQVAWYRAMQGQPTE